MYQSRITTNLGRHTLLPNKISFIGTKFLSVELSPTRKLKVSVLNFLLHVHFYSITWHRISAAFINHNTPIPALDLAENLLTIGKQVVLHISCWNLSRYEALLLLDRAKDIGVVNLFVISGESAIDETRRDFIDAKSLIYFIRMHYGNYFSIGVAGYPAKHPSSVSQHDDLLALKQKVDAGSDFIFTQLEFDFHTIKRFKLKCQSIGITVPIITGLYVIDSYRSLKMMLKVCRVDMPLAIRNIVERIKHDPMALANYGIYQTTILVKQLLADNTLDLPGVHIFSVNKLDNVCSVYLNIGFNLNIPRLLSSGPDVLLHKQDDQQSRKIMCTYR